MNTQVSRPFSFALILVTLALASCKPAETVPPASTPVPTNTPAVAPASAASAPTNTAPVADAPKSSASITPEEAKNHVDETVTVKGKVFGVHVTQKGDVFMNVGAAYPNAPFTVVCFGGKVPSEQLTALDGKTISVSGKVKEFNGKYEIVVTAADQISQ